MYKESLNGGVYKFEVLSYDLFCKKTSISERSSIIWKCHKYIKKNHVRIGKWFNMEQKNNEQNFKKIWRPENPLGLDKLTPNFQTIWNVQKWPFRT